MADYIKLTLLEVPLMEHKSFKTSIIVNFGCMKVQRISTYNMYKFSVGIIAFTLLIIELE